MDNIFLDVASENRSYAVQARSHIGGREEQQDRAYLHVDQDRIFAAVCDGMGGGPNGRLASETAVSSLRASYVGFPGDEAADVPDFLRQAMYAADQAVRAALPGRGGGTTMTAAIVLHSKMHWVSVGDSRLYIMRSGELLQATRDHNYRLRLDEMLRQEELTPEAYDAQLSRGDALISYLGMGGITLFDLTQTAFELRSGDVVLLATDGLFRALSEDELREILRSDLPAAQKADQLLEQAAGTGDRSALDNITFIMMEAL